MTQVATAAKFLVLLASLAAVPAVSAAQADPPRAKALEAIAACRATSNADARLKCYDAAAAEMLRAEAKGDIVVVDREQARTVRRQGFGFSLPSLSLFDRGEKPEEIERVTLKVERAWRDGGGRWNIALEGDQVWRQIDAGDFTVTPKPGAQASIRKASLGSYLMTIGGRAGVRMHRDK